MWYALGHILTPPPAITRPAAPRKPVITTAPASPSPTASQPPATVKGAVFEMPTGLPAFLKKTVTVPLSDQPSEFAALKSVARQIGVSFSHTGPDYALTGTKVPFGTPVPAYEFLWYAGNSYVPGVVDIKGGGAISAVNQKPGG